MKFLLKILFFLPAKIWSHIWSPSLLESFRFRRAQVYGAWCKQSFSSVEGNPVIYAPIYLCGGKKISLGAGFCADSRLRIDAFDIQQETIINGDQGAALEPPIQINNQSSADSLRIIIGKNVNIQKDCHIGAANKITIGDNVLIASRVYISDHSHGEITSDALQIPPINRPIYSKGEVHIGNNVWLGEGVIVLPNVTIGDHSIIGAGSVVTKSIPTRSIAAGNPARVIKIL